MKKIMLVVLILAILSSSTASALMHEEWTLVAEAEAYISGVFDVEFSFDEETWTVENLENGNSIAIDEIFKNPDRVPTALLIDAAMETIEPATKTKTTFVSLSWLPVARYKACLVSKADCEELVGPSCEDVLGLWVECIEARTISWVKISENDYWIVDDEVYVREEFLLNAINFAGSLRTAAE